MPFQHGGIDAHLALLLHCPPVALPTVVIPAAWKLRGPIPRGAAQGGLRWLLASSRVDYNATNSPDSVYVLDLNPYT
jgi:hypothetical protein